MQLMALPQAKRIALKMCFHDSTRKILCWQVFSYGACAAGAGS